ncbi:uncharacterized protein LOC131160523 [Malania oleifera]|uniref:uncharacterized protein LOC131160523 n=1 Tax=Malania oleifera TaxID=397392 RepID=UPI0025AE2D09|nr:uncharacterized protein LOC131160523 [Malania oleifera]
MADIAMLVAEEYERRVKSTARDRAGAEPETVDLFSYVPILARRLEGKQSPHWVKIGKVNGGEKLQILKWVSEPKSQIGAAAINGFFSA